MNTKNLSNHELIQLTKEKTKQERSVSIEVITLIREIETRRLYAALGFSSLFDFVTKELGYDESAALRRISAARIIRDLPEIEAKVASNDLTLTNLSMAQSFFRREEKTRTQKMTTTEKREILSRLENKSSREAQKTLLQISPATAQPQESLRQITDDLAQLKLVINDDLKNKLNKLKTHFSHKNPSMTYLELLNELADLALKKMEKNKVSKNSDTEKMNKSLAGEKSMIQPTNNPPPAAAGEKNGKRNNVEF